MKIPTHQHVSAPAGALLVTAVLASVSAYGAVVNGDFSSGLGAPWSAIGDVTIQGPNWNNGPSSPVAPSVNQALLTTATAVIDVPSPSAIETFLGLTAGSVSGLNAHVNEGSALKQTLLGLSAGDTLRFSWNFVTGEDSTGKDVAFYTLHSVGSSGSLVQLATPASTLHTAPGVQPPPAPAIAYTRETGFQTTSAITVPSGGDWVLGFGVVDAGISPDVDSALGIANVTYTAVPEPWAWSLMSALALGGLAVARRVRYNRA